MAKSAVTNGKRVQGVKMTTDELQKLERAGARKLRRFRNLPRQDREEVLQDALIAVVRQEPVENPLGLLDKIIHDKAVDRTRRRVKRADVEQPYPDLSAVSPSTPPTHDDLLFAVGLDQIIRVLPREERDAFILMDLRGVSAYEAARLLGSPASTIRNRRDAVRNLIQKEMQ